MSKTATRRPSTALAPRPPSRARVIVARAAPVARRVAGATARAAYAEKHTLVALGAAGLLGYLDREGQLDSFSMVDGVDVKAQVALALWVAGKFSKSQTIQHAATGVASVALYDMVKNRD